MQITLNQDEIQQAIEAYVREQITISDSQKIVIDLRAGRGDNGFSATLDIRPISAPAAKPKPAVTRSAASPEPKEVPQTKIEDAVKPKAKSSAKTEPEPETAPDIPETSPESSGEAAPSPEDKSDAAAPAEKEEAEKPAAKTESEPPRKAGSIFNFQNTASKGA